MRLRNVRRSTNVEDRRASGGVGGKAGIGGGALLLVLVVGYCAGVDVTPLLDQTMTSAPTGQTRELTPQEEKAADLHDLER